MLRHSRKPSAKDSRRFPSTDVIGLGLGGLQGKTSKRVEIKLEGRDATPKPFSELVESKFSIDDVPLVRPDSFDSIYLPHFPTESLVWGAARASANAPSVYSLNELRSLTGKGNSSEVRKTRVLDLTESQTKVVLSIDGSLVLENATSECIYESGLVDKQRASSDVFEQGSQTYNKSKRSAFVRASIPTNRDSSCNPISCASGELRDSADDEVCSTMVKDVVESMVLSVVKQHRFLLDVSESVKLKFSDPKEDNPFEPMGIPFSEIKSHSKLSEKLRMMECTVRQSFS